ncbi:MAG: serine protease [Chlamydiia bacterium]|nr:serine protease [Chlamydiia bacterium]
MLVAVGVALLSLILIYLEFFVPGAVLGILGGVGFCLSILLFVWESANLWQIIVFVVLIIFLLVLMIKLALWKLKQKPAMFAKEEQSGYLASEFDKELIGKSGEALTDLRPSGHIKVEGMRHQAVSESLYIKKGESVKIVAGEGARLIVRKQ